MKHRLRLCWRAWKCFQCPCTRRFSSSSGFDSAERIPFWMKVAASSVMRRASAPLPCRSGRIAPMRRSTCLGRRSARSKWKMPNGKSRPFACWSARVQDAKAAAPQDAARDLFRALRNRLGCADFVFHPVDVLLVPVMLEVDGVVGVVVHRRHRPELVESLDQHAFAVHVGEPQRPVDCVHTPRHGPRFDGRAEGARDLEVIDEIDPSEARVPLIPRLDVALVDDAGDAPDDLAATEGQPVLRLTEIERGIMIAVQRFSLVKIERRDPAVVVFVQVEGKADELPQIPLRFDLADFDPHPHLPAGWPSADEPQITSSPEPARARMGMAGACATRHKRLTRRDSYLM